MREFQVTPFLKRVLFRRMAKLAFVHAYMVFASCARHAFFRRGVHTVTHPQLMRTAFHAFNCKALNRIDDLIPVRNSVHQLGQIVFALEFSLVEDSLRKEYRKRTMKLADAIEKLTRLQQQHGPDIDVSFDIQHDSDPDYPLGNDFVNIVFRSTSVDSSQLL